MLFDLGEPDAAFHLQGNFDICIAGGGVAGITLAIKLAEQNKSVVLLEAGDLEFTTESQSLYNGTNVGFQYFELDAARLRYLGGSSNHWAGMCRPLEAWDFEPRKNVDQSGWPINIDDLLPFAAEADAILGLRPSRETATLQGSDGSLIRSAFGNSPVRFKDKYLEQLRNNSNVSLFLNANLTDIRLNTGSGRVSAFEVRSYKRVSNPIQVSANNYILALGGIENARVLLNADSQIPEGLGNQSGAVGRYFMEHLEFDTGYFVSYSEKSEFLDSLRFVAASDAMIRREGIGNGALRLSRSHDRSISEGGKLSLEQRAKRLICSSEILTEFAYWVRGNGINCTKAPDSAGNIHAQFEQVPNRNSRVFLTDERDRLGLRKIGLDWQLSPLDKKTLKVLALELGRYFARTNLGRVKIYDWILDDEPMNFPSMSDGEQVAAFHHMGTTRMGSSPGDGVVDRDCRVFGTENLFIAGSSAFRTGGYANPTYTIVQLALRLAQHIGRL